MGKYLNLSKKKLLPALFRRWLVDCLA